MEPAAIGPKMKMMEQKVSLKLWKMSFRCMMMLIANGIKERSKVDRPDEAKVKQREKEKEKAEEVEDTSSQEDPKAEVSSHMVGEGGYDEEWQEEEEDWKDSWNEGYWAHDQDWNDGYWATEELY